MVRGKRVFKKVLCLFLTFIMIVGAVSFPEQKVNAADTREYTILSTDTTGERDIFSYYPSSGWSRGQQIDEYFTNGSVESQVSNGANASDIYYTVKFSGTGIALYGYKAPGHGATVKVFVDGTERGEFDSYAQNRSSSDVILMNIEALDNGDHTLKVMATGGKNASADNSFIEVTKAVVTVPIEKVPATDFFFTEETCTIRVGESKNLSYRLAPDNSYAPEDLQFASDDTSVASVDSSGRITAKKVGAARITASSESVGFSKSIEVTVLERKEDIDATYVDSGDQYQQKAYETLLAGNRKLGERAWAWKNDKAVAEIAIMSKQKALESVSVGITDLEGFGAVIPASSVKLSFVREVKAYTGHAGWYAYNTAGTMPSGPREYFPEVIYSGDPVSMDRERLQLVWVEASVPEDALAGIYKGTITVSAGNTDETISLDYTLEVLDVAQPDPQDYDFDVEYWSHPYNVAYYYNVEPFSEEHLELLRQHMELYKSLGGHAITASIVEEAWGGQTYGGGNSIHYPSMIKWIKNTDGTWEFDYTDFDKWVALNKEIGIADKIICYSMMPWDGIVKYKDMATNTVKSMTANPANSTQYSQVWQPFLEDFVAHLDEKGWFGQTYIGFDERSNMGTAFDLIDSVTNRDGKALKKSAAFNDFSHNQAIFNRLNYASVGLQQIRENLTPFKQQIVTRRENNQDLTMYTATEHVPNSFTKSNPVESYWTILYAGSLNTTGFLRWAYDAWVADPLEESTHSSFPAGDCFLVYPSEQEDEVKESKFSLRLAKLDEGVRDVNKLYIMREGSQEMADGVADILSHVKGDRIEDYEYSIMPKTDNWGRDAKWLTESGKNSMLSDMEAVKQGIYDLTKDFITEEYPDRVQQIELAKPERTEFESGEVIQLQAVAQPASAAGSIQWSSSNEAAASVDRNGQVTMKKEGKATITVCSAKNANIGQSIELSVKLPEAKKPLFEQMEAASKLEQENYTEESWAALEEALEEAERVMKKGASATLEEIQSACELLENAITGLKAPGGTAQEHEVTYHWNFAQGGTKMERVPDGEYAEPPAQAPERDGWIFTGKWYLEPECETEFICSETPITRDRDLYAEWQKDEETVPGLTQAKKELEAVLAQISDLSYADYSQEGWKMLYGAVWEARNALESDNAKVVTEAKKKLEAAIAYTKTEETQQKKDQLNNRYEACGEEYDEADYTPESWAALEEALEEAERVMKKGASATLEEIQSALDLLESAVMGLKPPEGTVQEHEVTYHWNFAQGGTKTDRVPDGGYATAPKDAPKRDGYTFTGKWYLDAKCSKEYAFGKVPVTEPLTLYAGWKKKETVNSGGNDKNAAERKKKETAKKAVSDAKKKADAFIKAGRGNYTVKSWNAFLSAYNAVKNLTEAQKDKMTADNLNKLANDLTKAQAKLSKENVKISSLQFAAKTYQIANGKSVNLKKELTILPESAANQKLVWKISNAKFANLNSSTGIVKALKKGIKKSVTVTVMTEDGTVSAKATVKVMKGRVSKITAKGAKKVKAKAGKSVTLKTNVKTTGGKPVNKALKWTSLNPEIATVKGSGKLAANAKVKVSNDAKKGQKAVITAVSMDGANKKLKFTVTVN